MKKCIYCGKEFSDDATTCAIDANPLTEVSLVAPPMKAAIKYCERKRFRFFAGLLAAGGMFWGLLCIGTFFDLNWGTLAFIPGYIITVGYILRCFCAPRLLWRQTIWGTSAVVQSAWLVFFISGFPYTHFQSSSESGDSITKIAALTIVLTWWIFAIAISIYGFRFDKTQPN
jgi:hypothetical protein